MEVSSIWVVFATLLASACVCQGQGCSATSECDNLGGSCVATGSCSGISYDACGSGCTCCIPDNGNCTRLPTCEYYAGTCLHLEDSCKCPGFLDPNTCLGTNCTCCMYGCPSTYDCAALGGYCFRTDGPHVCGGDVLDLCIYDVCKCCVDPQCPHGQGHAYAYGHRSCAAGGPGQGNSQGNGNGNGQGNGNGNGNAQGSKGAAAAPPAKG